MAAKVRNKVISNVCVRFRKLREASGRTQVDLAQETKILQNRLSVLENGIQKVSFDDVVKLAAAFRIKLEVLSLPDDGFQRFVDDYKRSVDGNTFEQFIATYDLTTYKKHVPDDRHEPVVLVSEVSP